MQQLNRGAILQQISNQKHCDFELEVHQQLNSTNTYLMSQPLADKIKICLAESQTNGRGRHGKSWYSPEGSSIYLSFAHRLKKEVSELSGFSLVIGLTLAETLQKYCEDYIQVKWPNDLLVNGKKLSGVLIEIKNETNGAYRIITGLGINVNLPELSENYIDQPSISLNQCHPFKELSRNMLAADIINNILKSITLFENSGFGDFHQKWNKLDIWYGQPVVLEIGDNKIMGIHRGIDLSGALILEQGDQISSWNSGEVRLRGAR